ncbi:hypothetical protein [uncultured Sphingomonas sp.]|uniref:hypothetical protein n=1 Tax=uncultured Sphingomonas sp. TaxID=158754 RepID=UPI0025E0F00D|nr:hypothetical protein [uncultured Sphingomonas sp.]
MNDDAVSASRTGALADTGDARATERNTPTNAIIRFIIHPIDYPAGEDIRHERMYRA